MPQRSTTTARHLGAPSAPFRFGTLTHVLRPPVEYAGLTSPALFSHSITLDVYPPKPWRRRADRASSAATNHALQLAATDLEYEVTRVKSPVLGRDLNPMGRGDGTYYCNGGNASGGSVAIRGAKPTFVGDSVTGFGSSVNNQCVPGPGGYGTPTPPPVAEKLPIEIYPLTEHEGHWRIKRWPSNLFEDLIYWNEIDKRCVGNSTGVVYQEGIVYAYCQDKCLERNAQSFATMLHVLCRNPNTGHFECDVYAAALPKNRWQAIHEWDHWGAVVKWDCAQDWQSPLVRCLCRKKLWGISAKEVNDCLKELLGGQVTNCLWYAGAGGGGDDCDKWCADAGLAAEFCVELTASILGPPAVDYCANMCSSWCEGEGLDGNNIDDWLSIVAFMDHCCLELLEGII